MGRCSSVGSARVPRDVGGAVAASSRYGFHTEILPPMVVNAYLGEERSPKAVPGRPGPGQTREKTMHRGRSGYLCASSSAGRETSSYSPNAGRFPPRLYAWVSRASAGDTVMSDSR
jgi:hypothetical protein